MVHAKPVLHDEVIGEILSCLPVKSLLRFRCVSKYWSSLISDPHFVKLHLQRSPKDANVILTLQPATGLPGELEEDFQVMPCSIRSLIENRSSNITVHDHYFSLKFKYWVIGSCNGLVCLCGSEDKFRKYWVRFWNPALRIRSNKSPFLCVNDQSGCTFGFGYDESSDAYKVVAVIYFKQSSTTQVKIYTMGDHRWREIERFPAFPVTSGSGGKFLSDTLNWLANSDQLVIVSLDLKTETYKQLSLPIGINEFPNSEPKIGVLGDCLCLFHHYRTHFAVWQMKEFGVERSWTQFANISYPPPQLGSFNPVCILEDGDVLLLLNYDDEIILYNRRDNTVERTEIEDGAWINAKNYVQSLILPQ